MKKFIIFCFLFLVIFALFSVNPAYCNNYQGIVTGLRLVKTSPPLSVCTLRLDSGEQISFYAPFARIKDKVISAEGIRPFIVGDRVEVSLDKKEDGTYFLDIHSTPGIYRRISSGSIPAETAANNYQYQVLNGKLHWPRAKIPIKFYYHHKLCYEPLDDVLQCVINAANTWNDVETSFMRFEYAGNASGRPICDDGKNSIGWGYSYELGEYTLGLCVWTYNKESLEIIETDIYFNWLIDFGYKEDEILKKIHKYDFFSVALHELGHAAGLDDVDDINYQQDVMYGYLSPYEIKRNPTSNDIFELSSRYPAGIIQGRLLTPSGSPVYLSADYPVYVFAFDKNDKWLFFSEVSADGGFYLHSLPVPYSTSKNIVLFFNALVFSLFADEPVQSLFYNGKYTPEEADELAVTPAGVLDLGDIHLPAETVIRLYGNNRFHTASLTAEKFFSSSTTAIVASGMNYPDALCAAPLSAFLDAPVLLTRQDRLSSEASDYITSAGVTDVIIVGGPLAVSYGVEAELRLLGFNVTRIAGSNRFETAAEIASTLYTLGAATDTAFFATGMNFPDALSVGAVAAHLFKPVLLVAPDSIPPETQAVIDLAGITRSIVVGGEAAVSSSVFNRLPSPERWAGQNRFETAAVVAQQAASLGVSFAEVHLATGMNFPDALAAGAAAGKNGSPVLLTTAETVPSSTSDFLSGNKNLIDRVYLYGGGSAISYSQQNLVRSLIN